MVPQLAQSLKDLRPPHRDLPQHCGEKQPGEGRRSQRRVKDGCRTPHTMVPRTRVQPVHLAFYAGRKFVRLLQTNLRSASPAEETDNLLSGVRPRIESSPWRQMMSQRRERPPRFPRTVKPKSNPRKTGVRRCNVPGVAVGDDATLPRRRWAETEGPLFFGRNKCAGLGRVPGTTLIPFPRYSDRQLEKRGARHESQMSRCRSVAGRTVAVEVRTGKHLL